MVLLMARLGLRAHEVIAIQLDDIDWRAGELLVRGKGQLRDRLPLRRTLAKRWSYIQRDRKTKSRALFVTHHLPPKPFADAQVLNGILEAGFKKAGIKPPPICWLTHPATQPGDRYGVERRIPGRSRRYAAASRPPMTTIYAKSTSRLALDRTGLAGYRSAQ